ncbi:MAG: hypothetical protein ACMXX8_02165 [Candidatus Woesearchaeota archaeon]
MIAKVLANGVLYDITSNTTNNGIIESVSSPVSVVLNYLYVFLGGIFGIYVILFVVKLFINFRLRSYMREIKEELIDIKKSISQLENQISKVDNKLNKNVTSKKRK